MDKYVTISEFISLRLQHDRLKDPLARPVGRSTINTKIAIGELSTKIENGTTFINWTTGQNVQFRRYFQVPAIKSQKLTHKTNNQ